MTPYDEGVSTLDLLRLVRLIDSHQPSIGEALPRLGWSRAKFKRVLGLARRLGVEIVTAGPSGREYYELIGGGVLDLTACRALWSKGWLDATGRAGIVAAGN